VVALLLVLFLVVPLLELAIIGQVQQWLGWPTTILILVLDSLVGAYLVRMQGAAAWRRFSEALGQVRLPAEEVVDGALIVFGGALLLTPGFFTDAVGLLCVLTPTRTLLNRLVRSRFTLVSSGMGAVLGGRVGGRVGGGAAGGRPGRRAGRPSSPSGSGGPPRSRPPGAIDVEVVDVRRNDPPPRPRPAADGADEEAAGS
jgi:UPF0716 protein FxsA